MTSSQLSDQQATISAQITSILSVTHFAFVWAGSDIQTSWHQVKTELQLSFVWNGVPRTKWRSPVSPSKGEFPFLLHIKKCHCPIVVRTHYLLLHTLVLEMKLFPSLHRAQSGLPKGSSVPPVHSTKKECHPLNLTTKCQQCPDKNMRVNWSQNFCPYFVRNYRPTPLRCIACGEA